MRLQNLTTNGSFSSTVHTIATFVTRRATRGAMFTLALCFSVSQLQAQFSGPSLGAGTPVNAPITPTTDPAILYPADRAIQLGVGDSLVVHLFGQSEFASPERVGLDGALQVPLIGPVPVLGLTLYQASQVIAIRLKNAGMYRDPQVTLQIVDSPNQVVTVSGEMHGLVPVVGRRSLLSVLSAAGQYPITGSHTVIINRPGLDQPIVVDLGTDPSRSARADVPLFPLDTVVVPRVGVVYVLGAFKIQGAIPLEQNSPLTLMQAASLAGGPGFEGQYKDLRVVRTVGFERKVIKLDLMKVMRGKASDPVLQADDIIFLPTNQLKAALTNGGFGAASNVASLLLVAFQTR
ncbi:polysaccharide biosynthesis/export family protein [Granulicella arctica]|uniref:polysaccharide biosynthesis/export family protein n=1 Tax=Granulicella arctica TaxID=940613 RepID=UPI0021E0A592|nr:polysaccharide biosynthesis/export family protein [Granulicella arctica]